MKALEPKPMSWERGEGHVTIRRSTEEIRERAHTLRREFPLQTPPRRHSLA
jgi:hypothetical protein